MKKLMMFLLVAVMSFMCVNALAKKKMKMFASNYPLAYFVQRLTLEPVDFPNTNDDPSQWEPSERDLKNIQQADLIFIVGAGYEKWLPKISQKNKTIINTTKAFHDQLLLRENKVGNNESKYYCTTWIDFKFAVKMLDSVKDALLKTNRWDNKKIEINYFKLKNELLQLDAQLRSIVEKNRSLPLLVSDSNYDYMARRYGTNLKTLNWSHNTMPSEKQWYLLEHIMIDHPAHWMIWEVMPDANIAQRLKSYGVRSIVFNPCQNKPEFGDFISEMKQNVTNLRLVYDYQSTPKPSTGP